MAIQEVRRWQTVDGTFHDSYIDARNHEIRKHALPQIRGHLRGIIANTILVPDLDDTELEKLAEIVYDSLDVLLRIRENSDRITAGDNS